MTGNDTILKRLIWPIRLTWAGLWAERLSRSFWPLWTIALLTFAILAFGVQDQLPLEVLWAWMVIVVLGGIASVVYGIRTFRRPRRAEAIARLDAAMPGQPIAAWHDTQAIGATDPASAAVWQAHRERMAKRAAAARAVPPRPDLAARDPFALRYVALTALVAALMFGSVWRVATVSDLATGGAAATTGPQWEAWVQPPSYTGKPSLYLNDLTAGPVDAPQGSRIQIRLYGAPGALTVDETVSARTEAATASDPRQDFVLNRSGTLTIAGNDGREWSLRMIPDMPPRISGPADMERETSGEMRLPFQAEDDYGVTAANATIALDMPAIDRRYGLTVDPEARDPITLDLPLPIAGDRRKFSEVLTQDLAQHPFANLPVTISLVATDAAGQSGTAEPLHVTLPGKRFFDPLASALIEMRRDLLWSRANAPRVGEVLRAITYRPEGLFTNERAFLRLRVLTRELSSQATTLTPEARDGIAAQLWEIALLIEEGNPDSALERMRQAQDRLSQAMRDGADPSEIEDLMRDLREATDDYISKLAEDARQNPDSQQAQGETQELSSDQLQQMMDRIQQLMNEGRMAEAQQLMEQLRQLMDNLQVAEGGNGEGSGQSGMQGLQQTLRDQQELSDDAFRNLQDADPGQGSRDLADRQRALRDQLGELGDLPDGADQGQQSLDRARRAMEQAEQALREGDTSGALDRQAQAMEEMREGLRQFDQALAEEGNPGSDTAEDGNDGAPDKDPLGRATGEGRRIGSDDNLNQSEDELRRRAEELLGEIRRRSGEQSRPEAERDYLRRLLDFF
ncbi:DUF4175 domain-containing protein [Falsirhodobacter sp. alg1]|uniref:DUF4175 domain-containing protein n=1 Tax=Falsirhodobacter sp. alg1 TaxID=1472418 RepID=UPI000788CF74|nr:DUF4175 domain-containing protein [Falsirhodobacter sp. alg1]